MRFLANTSTHTHLVTARSAATTRALAAMGTSCAHFVETHGRLGKPAMTLLHMRAHAAERHSNGYVSAASFTFRVLQELACVNVEWNARIETAIAGMFSLVAGQAFMPGDPQPPVWEDDRACACVCGFWGVFALFRSRLAYYRTGIHGVAI